MDTVTVVNMIPYSLSGETNQDSEPNISVNPANPMEIAATAFTPNPDGSSADSPIFYSSNGGATWTLLEIIAGTPVRDQTLRFSGSGNLYAGVLWGGGWIDTINYDILRTNDFSGATEMTRLARRQNDDQPFIQAATVPSGPDAGKDRIVVGSNDWSQPNIPSAVDISQDAAAVSPTIITDYLEDHTVSRDGFQTRPAIHPDGTVYAVFYGWVTDSSSSNVTIVRDDDWGNSSPTPFNALKSGAKRGINIATGVNNPGLGLYLGQQRIGGDLSIAVHPADSQTVYVCWGAVDGSTYTLHIQKSVDGGKKWSGNLRTVANATNPALAFNSSGTLGFLYQQVTGTDPNQRWQSIIELTGSDFASKTTNVLADTPATDAPWDYDPYIGDYVYLTTAGNSFYGIFCADNTPDLGNFPSGVTFQRAADFTTKTLKDLMGNAVSTSIDPYFFSVTPWKWLKIELKEIKEFDKFWLHEKPPQVDLPQKLLQPLENNKFTEKLDEGWQNWQQYEWGVIVQLAAKVDALQQQLATARVFIEPAERPQVQGRDARSAAPVEEAARAGRKKRKDQKKKGRGRR